VEGAIDGSVRTLRVFEGEGDMIEDGDDREVRIDRVTAYQQKLCMSEQPVEVIAPSLDGYNSRRGAPQNLPHSCHNPSKS
jgi:hypothetical protein